MIRKILFATDLGPFSAHALAHVADLALHHRAKVYTLHAVEPLAGLAQAVVSGAPESLAVGPLLLAIRCRLLESLTDELSGADEALPLFEEVLVEQGRPAEVILKQAQLLEVDLVVLGSHGHESMASNVLGAVTARVLQLSKVPVYMVPMSRPIAASPAVSAQALHS